MWFFSSRFPVLLRAAQLGSSLDESGLAELAVEGDSQHPLSKPERRLFLQSTRTPSSAVILSLDFQRDLNWPPEQFPAAFVGVVLLGNPARSSRSRAIADRFEFEVVGSSQAQPCREESLKNLIRCHLSFWGLTESDWSWLCCCPSVQETQTCGSKSWL